MIAPMLAFVALMAGTIAPVLIGSMLDSSLANPIWGSLYGGGFWLWNILFGLPPVGNIGAAYVMFGAVIWPIFVTITLSLAIKKAIEASNSSIFLLLFTTTLLILIPSRICVVCPIYINYFR